MGIKKYKYYFRKPKSEIIKDLLRWLAIVGLVCISASSPYFIRSLLANFKKWRKYPNKKISDAFSNLKKQGLIEIQKKKHQIYIKLTEKGRKKAGIFQINDLKIKKSKKWDGKWRIVIFDIAQFKKTYREAFRGKLKELGFYPLQKSVWIAPFDYEAEIDLLRDFFGLSEDETRLIITENIGNANKLKRIFNLL